VVCGTAGVGKTGLVVRWAHQKRGQFPDGGLYLDLRGYDPGEPLAPSDALVMLLRYLGTPGAELPVEPDELLTQYHELTSGKRMLIVLDNAQNAEHVRSLLPANNSSCFTVVTSRNDLAGLVIKDDTPRLVLDRLPQPDTVALLRHLIGPRVDAEPDAAVELAELGLRLPLTLRICAEQAVSRHTLTLRELVQELLAESNPLDRFTGSGDQHTAIRAVFSWSYRHLHSETATAFRLMGLCPGQTIDPYAAAALNNTTLAQARQRINELKRAYLVDEIAPNRYSMHDLLREYARELATTVEPRQRRQSSLARLLCHYLFTASIAMNLTAPHERDRRPLVADPGSPTPQLSSPDAAAAWLDAEQANMIAAAMVDASDGHIDYTSQLSAILFHYLDNGAHYHQALLLHRRASETTNPALKARALASLGVVNWRLGRNQESLSCHEKAGELFHKVGNRFEEGRALINRGVVSDILGHYDEALQCYREALAITLEIGDRCGEGIALGNLGVVLAVLGRCEEALLIQLQRIAIAREVGDRMGERVALTNLGNLCCRLVRYADATEYLLEALALSREAGDRSGEASTLNLLGDVCNETGRPTEGLEYRQNAVIIAREIDDREGLANALNGLGTSTHLSGSPSAAIALHHESLSLSHELGDRFEQARAHDGIARSALTLGQVELARQHWGSAFTLYLELGIPEADIIAAKIKAIDKRQDNNDNAAEL
jgi:tetratricopeptide (TPR) repeat protein